MRPLTVPQRAPRRVELVWADADRYPQLAGLATGGLLAVAVMAVVGLPPVDLHGPLHYLGVMDPACGLTRGMVALAHGRPATAWAYNPASPVVLAGAVGALARVAVGRRTGRWLEVRVARRRLAMFLVTVALLGLWANQQRHAALLRARHAPAAAAADRVRTGVPTARLEGALRSAGVGARPLKGGT